MLTRCYLQKSDDWLLPTHYKQIIEMETQPDWIELLTWNDYSESHYLGPIHETSIFPGTSGLYVCRRSSSSTPRCER